jgi:cell pole-organizing protein PopZ
MNESISNHSGPGSHAEPSMDEILASIRRILKDDEASLPPAPAPEEDVLVLNAQMIVPPADISSATELPADTGLLGGQRPSAHDFHEARNFDAAPERPAPAAAEPEPEQISAQPEPAAPPELEQAAPPPDFEQAAPPPDFKQAAPPPERASAPPEPQHGETPETTDMDEHQLQTPDGLIGQHAVNQISNSIGAMVRSVTQERAVAVSRMGTTIEDIVREELRPVLKAWLDTHLPSLVERIVRAEIERVIDRSQL